jgi:hypothetical protein
MVDDAPFAILVVAECAGDLARYDALAAAADLDVSSARFTPILELLARRLTVGWVNVEN